VALLEIPDDDPSQSLVTNRRGPSIFLCRISNNRNSNEDGGRKGRKEQREREREGKKNTERRMPTCQCHLPLPQPKKRPCRCEKPGAKAPTEISLGFSRILPSNHTAWIMITSTHSLAQVFVRIYRGGGVRRGRTLEGAWYIHIHYNRLVD